MYTKLKKYVLRGLGIWGIMGRVRGSPLVLLHGCFEKRTHRWNPATRNRCFGLFPILAVGLLGFKVYVVLALCQELDCSAQWPRIPAAQPQSIPAVPSHQVSLQCPTAEYPCSALQCPAAECPCSAQYPCRAQPQTQSIPAVANHQVFLPPSRKHYISCPIRALGWGCLK